MYANQILNLKKKLHASFSNGIRHDISTVLRVVYKYYKYVAVKLIRYSENPVLKKIFNSIKDA